MRVPIRLRLTLGFAGVMALLLATGGALLYASLTKSLDAELDRSLNARAGDVQALIAEADQGLSQRGRSVITERGESIAQVIDANGRVFDATPGLRDTPLLTAAELRRVESSRRLLIARRDLRNDNGAPVRLLAIPFTAQGQRLVVVVGAALDERDETLRNLTVLLFIGVPIALLLASLAGYGLATAAFRPVEAMRLRAERISGQEPGARLPLTAASDEVHRLGETLNQMLERIDRSMERERSFASDASHELRTPLAILKSELELARRPGRPIQELRDAVDSAAEETDRLVQLAEDLLVIARLDQGRLPVRPTSIPVHELLDTVKERFALRAAEQRRELIVEAPDELVVHADELRIEQAVSNLVENALRHGRGPITITAQNTGAMVELHVRDHGTGFPEEFLPQAFERFTRADTARGRGGAGLGLAIVAAIARAHGGHAFVRNADGADAWIAIPAGSPGEAILIAQTDDAKTRPSVGEE